MQAAIKCAKHPLANWERDKATKDTTERGAVDLMRSQRDEIEAEIPLSAESQLSTQKVGGKKTTEVKERAKRELYAETR